MRKNPHVRICGGLGSATTLVYPTLNRARATSIATSAIGNAMQTTATRATRLAAVVFLATKNDRLSRHDVEERMGHGESGERENMESLSHGQSRHPNEHTLDFAPEVRGTTPWYIALAGC